MLWACFLGLQLGKSRFPRCTAPYFSIFVVQAHAPCITSASHMQTIGSTRVPACMLARASAAQCREMRINRCSGATIEVLTEMVEFRSLKAPFAAGGALVGGKCAVHVPSKAGGGGCGAAGLSAADASAPGAVLKPYRVGPVPCHHRLFFVMHSTFQLG